MEIRKISKLKTSQTQESKKIDVEKIKSMRNRLLLSTDWIFTDDNNLSEKCLDKFKKWRRDVKRVNDLNNSDYDSSIEYLKRLEDSRPQIEYNFAITDNIEVNKKELKKLLNKVIARTSSMLFDDGESRELMIERFEEATRYVNGKITNNFLMEIEAKDTGVSLDIISKKFIDMKKSYLMKLITIEKVKKKYINAIKNIDNVAECAKIHSQLTELMHKKWI